MPKKNENYAKDPAKQLTRVLRECEWESIGVGLWAKGLYRLFLDEMGVFLFRFQKGSWVRIQGLAFADFRPIFIAEQCIVFMDKTKLNLAGG